MEPTKRGPVLAVFASNKGPGDAERASLMSQAGTYFAKRGAQLVCLAEKGVIPVPLITAARAAGGAVQVVADASIVLPPALKGVTMEVVEDAPARLNRIAELAEGMVALPGSLASATELFGVWSAAKALGRNTPVVMLNRHKAFEVMRGYSVDVLSPGLPGYDRAIQFADNIEDLWSRISRLVSEAR
ncbi:LOG family protein [Devosia sp. J2-20]|jgi:predicted Rossmann-fold nucleotide-binding protein|uniref:LOG family protein n=1 Tax=Devosia TaxID=46913 RepID=UPI0022B00443|nr:MULTISPECIES: LOG family protein [Devosia]MCZ4344829.1 LOG family protein [Devosia neptuniae]WDQ97768.1 LOG family protein [Devosia sp. J2-20]|tara:strand:- start:46085 stop:46645 length:561 start_codon:yes stop_codon:yes gene_type:complete